MRNHEYCGFTVPHDDQQEHQIIDGLEDWRHNLLEEPQPCLHLSKERANDLPGPRMSGESSKNPQINHDPSELRRAMLKRRQGC